MKTRNITWWIGEDYQICIVMLPDLKIRVFHAKKAASTKIHL
ncbi:hypothetical protein [Dyadobacter sp. Leaf189]|nr:hypothetical protein [Dyadobacter sp. Leaf189]